MEHDTCIVWSSAPALQTLTSEEIRGLESPLNFSSTWNEHLRRHPTTWNGPLLQLVAADATRVLAAESDYRTYIEARFDGSSHGHVFLAVTGVLSIDSRFLIGLRSSSVDRPGIWEFAPAGGVEQFPLEEQLCREIYEELSIQRRDITVDAPVGMRIDQAARVADIVVPVRISTPWSEVKRNFHRGEYESVEIVGIESLGSMIESDSAVDDLFRCIVQWLRIGVISFVKHVDGAD